MSSPRLSSPPPASQPPRPPPPLRRPSSRSHHSRRSTSSFRSPPSLSPSTSLASPTVTLEHFSSPKQQSSSGSSSTSAAEMKRTLEADEARHVRLALERKEQLDRKGKGRADVVGLPTEFGGEGGGEVGMFLGKRRKVAGQQTGKVSPLSASSEEAGAAGPSAGLSREEAGPSDAQRIAPPLDPSSPPPGQQQVQAPWLSTWSWLSNPPPPPAASPAIIETPALPLPGPSPTPRAAAVAPAAEGGVVQRESTTTPASSHVCAPSAASQALAWIPKPVVEKVASLPVVRSYAGAPASTPSAAPPFLATAPKQDSVAFADPPPAASASQTSSAAVHEGYAPGAPSATSWFWPSRASPFSAASSAFSSALSDPSEASAPTREAEVPITTSTDPPAAAASPTHVIMSKASWFSLSSSGQQHAEHAPSANPSSTVESAAQAPAQANPVEVLLEDEKKDAPATSGAAAPANSSWWAYIPFVGGAPAEPGQLLVAEAPLPPLPPFAAAPDLDSDTVPAAPSCPTLPPAQTTSYLAPLSWIYSGTALRTATPSASIPISEPSSAPSPSSKSPQAAPTAAVVVPSSARRSSADPTPVPSPRSYSSWLTAVASKAVQPRGSASSSKAIGLGADVGEVMNIDGHEAADQAGSEAADQAGSLSSSAGADPARTHSPPSSIRSRKSSSFFFSAVSKSTSSSSLTTQGSKIAPLTGSSVEKSKAGSACRPSSIKAAPPNLVLPTFEDIFNRPPRSIPLPTTSKRGMAKKTLSALGTILVGSEKRPHGVAPQSVAQERVALGRERGQALPKALGVGGGGSRRRNVRRVVVLGVHGWFPPSVVRKIAGQPTGTSQLFAGRMRSALESYIDSQSLDALDSVTVIPLEGDGTVLSRVDKLFRDLVAREDWVEDLRRADAILVGTHSQGCPVSAHLLSRLFEEGYIRSPHNNAAVYQLDDILKATSLVDSEYPKVVVLGLCGVHLGPLTYLNQSSVVNYVLNNAAQELFDFQDTESAPSQAYIGALSKVLDHGCKLLFVASLNDQVVPCYSSIFAAAHHPNILRVLHIDGAAYDVSDFVTNLLVFCLQLRNAGLDDGGLVAHLSESVAHGLTGVGHSSAYAEDASYRLAVRYLFETSDTPAPKGSLVVDDFLASENRNSYDIPWILRGIMEDPLVLELFGAELNELRSNFDRWTPQTQRMKDLRRKLEPLRPKQSRRTVARSPLVDQVEISTPPSPAVKTEEPGRSRL